MMKSGVVEVTGRIQNPNGEQERIEAIQPVLLSSEGRPHPEWVRGRCPECGDDLVSNTYYVGGRGYIVKWECWNSLSETPTCEYYKVL